MVQENKLLTLDGDPCPALGLLWDASLALAAFPWIPLAQPPFVLLTFPSPSPRWGFGASTAEQGQAKLGIVE